MWIDLKMLKTGLVVLALWFTPLIAHAQAVQQKTAPAPAPTKPKVMFSENVSLAARELDWSKTYYLSFKKTKEAVYLKLAATHCTNAVKVLKATQASFPNTTRFYYKAKNRRFSACQFYDELRETAQRLDPRHHIQDIDNAGCDF